MFVYKKLTILLVSILFLFNNCTVLPGINKSPNKKNPSKELETSEYSINDVKINIIKINKLSNEEINTYSENQFNDLENKIKDYSEIYEYRYEYILGISDSISIDLTDTDDLDGVYKIDQEGMVDLPFIGKIKLDELTLNQAQNLLLQIIKSFYRNPDLQIGIEKFNSNKVYIVGAVENQTTISLNEQPLSLIEAAIKAGFKPGSENKDLGTSGLLRREGKVYKINLTNTFKNKDEKENFYLKRDDVIFIDKNLNSIHVFGEVSKPGIYFPDMNYSLTELISSAGMNQITANAKKVYVIREKFDTFLEVDIFQLDVRNPVNLIAGQKFKIKKDDIIFIPPAEITKWNRTISLLVPQTNLFNSYRPIVKNNLGLEK